MRAKLNGVELDLGSLRPGQLRECRCANDDDAVAVPACPMQQGSRSLNQALPDSSLVFLNNRTPDCFQRFVRQPEFAAIEEIAGVLQVAGTTRVGQPRVALTHRQSPRD